MRNVFVYGSLMFDEVWRQAVVGVSRGQLKENIDAAIREVQSQKRVT